MSDKDTISYYNAIKVFRIDKLHICSSFNRYADFLVREEKT